MTSIKFQLLRLLLLASISHGSVAAPSADGEAEFRRVNWLDLQPVLSAYKEQLSRAKRLGVGNQENRNDILFTPESRVLVNTTVTILCLLAADKANGYRTNSITLQVLEEGQSHRRSLLAPMRNLVSHTDQLNCWNYAQESVCRPLRACNSPARPELRTVGIITKEGWGIFQAKAGTQLQAHYQCVGEMQSILTAQERAERKLADYTTTASDVHPLEIFNSEIGDPRLELRSFFPRGQPLSAKCQVANSKPGSRFQLNLLLQRPLPPGTPGDNRDEVLASDWVGQAAKIYTLNWRGELALKSHHGLAVVCRVTDDWGKGKGRRESQDRLRVGYMFPAYVDNPRIHRQMANVRVNSFHTSYYTSPSRISLRQAEYALCKADGYPPPSISWRVKDAGQVWILNETMFISKLAQFGTTFAATCSASSSELSLSDEFTVDITVISANCPLPGIISIGLLQASLWYLLQVFGV